MSDVLFLGGPPLRPAPGCEGHRFHVLYFRWSAGSGKRWRKIVGYWTVGRWYLSGVEQVFPACEGPENCKYLAPLPEPSPASLVGAWPYAEMADDDETLHWLLPPRRRALGSPLPAGPQPAIFAFGLWSVLGSELRFGAEAMRAMGWGYIGPAAIGESDLQDGRKKRHPAERHPFPGGDPSTLVLAAAVGAPSSRAGAANGADQ